MTLLLSANVTELQSRQFSYETLAQIGQFRVRNVNRLLPTTPPGGRLPPSSDFASNQAINLIYVFTPALNSVCVCSKIIVILECLFV